MRFLVDEDVDVRLIRVLRKLGHDAKRIPSGTTNGAVIRLAHTEHRVLISRDTDFTDSVRFPPSRFSGIVHLDIHPPRLGAITVVLKTLLSEVAEPAFAGKLFVLDETGYEEFS